MEKNNSLVLGLVEKFNEFLINSGVDLNKVRYTETPMFSYDYEDDTINPIIGLYNGKIVVAGPTIIVSADTTDVEESKLANIVNNTKLGYVFHLSELTRTYENGAWPLRLRMVSLDDKVAILNDYDDMWNINGEESLGDKIEGIKLYFETNIKELEFIIINPKLLPFLANIPEFDKSNNSLCGLSLKLNSSLKEDIISLSTYDESFYLKINNG